MVWLPSLAASQALVNFNRTVTKKVAIEDKLEMQHCSGI